MKLPIQHTPDPSLDLYFERIVDVPAHRVWQAWTTPELLKQWFTPRPWRTTDCEIDLRPGGIFKTVMAGPEGQEFSGSGCFLEIIENKKLVWTSAMGPGYRPNITPEGAFLFTAVITLEDQGDQTKYSALVIHADEESCQKHKAMGFEGGCGSALTQMVEMIKSQNSL